MRCLSRSRSPEPGARVEARAALHTHPSPRAGRGLPWAECGGTSKLRACQGACVKSRVERDGRNAFDLDLRPPRAVHGSTRQHAPRDTQKRTNTNMNVPHVRRAFGCSVAGCWMWHPPPTPSSSWVPWQPPGCTSIGSDPCPRCPCGAGQGASAPEAGPRLGPHWHHGLGAPLILFSSLPVC